VTAAAASIAYSLPGQTSPTPFSTTTTRPGQEITVVGGPNATANIPGDKSDPADFYGIILVIVAIAVAIILTRLIFRRGGRQEGHPR
jgi:hypothetical protein